jgi:hypothetical protein
MNELADDIDDLVERCLTTGHLSPEDAEAVRQHLAADEPVRASATLEAAIDPQARSETTAVAVPTISTTATASSEGSG